MYARFIIIIIILLLLKGTRFIEPSMYPRFTLVGQSIGSLILAWEALSVIVPHVFVDSTGHPFSYPLARWLGGTQVENQNIYRYLPSIFRKYL